MAATRELRTLPVSGGAAVAEVFPALAQMLADRGPALLPVPADDPVRSRILVDSQRPHPDGHVAIDSSGM
ncbi:O-succinylbenzoic acid--CoA ligase, partial [Dietzia sp. DQ11-71]|nr:O-succinylbenzoic acid--CoA ligase [Dietzia sp. DQ11-71]